MSTPRRPIPTKLGQPSTSSPRTSELNRQRLGSLFSSLSFGAPNSSSPLTGSSSTPRRGGRGGWLSWISPAKPGVQSVPSPATGGNSASGKDVPGHLDQDEGCFVGGETTIEEEEEEGEADTVQSRAAKCHLDELPDEILLEILLRLPPSLQQLVVLTAVSKRFHAVAQSPQLWSQLLDSTPGFALHPSVRSRVVAVPNPPPGAWQDDVWRAEPALKAHSAVVPVHYPTLYRSRLALDRSLRSANPTLPPLRTVSSEHEDCVYCVHLSAPWLITGSGDKSIRIWRLDSLEDGVTGNGLRCVKVVHDAHERSVLGIRFEMDKDGRGGMMLTASSDSTAGVWRVDFGQDGQVEVVKTATLQGHTAGVLDVALGKTRIATSSRDSTIRVYDRETLEHLFTFTAHTLPVNRLAYNRSAPAGTEQLVSASGDGRFIIWDLIQGVELRRAGDGQGLACVVWEGPYIITGDKEPAIKVYDAESCTLLKTLEGHTDLVRSIAVDSSMRTVVSGSYDQTVRIWDLDSGKLLRRIQGDLSNLVYGVASAEGRVVRQNRGDGSVSKWAAQVFGNDNCGCSAHASVSNNRTVRVLSYGQELPYRHLFV